jgi:hypothetical protein
VQISTLRSRWNLIGSLGEFILFQLLHDKELTKSLKGFWTQAEFEMSLKELQSAFENFYEK